MTVKAPIVETNTKAKEETNQIKKVAPITIPYIPLISPPVPEIRIISRKRMIDTAKRFARDKRKIFPPDESSKTDSWSMIIDEMRIAQINNPEKIL